MKQTKFFNTIIYSSSLFSCFGLFLYRSTPRSTTQKNFAENRFSNKMHTTIYFLKGNWIPHTSAISLFWFRAFISLQSNLTFSQNFYFSFRGQGQGQSQHFFFKNLFQIIKFKFLIQFPFRKYILLCQSGESNVCNFKNQ